MPVSVAPSGKRNSDNVANAMDETAAAKRKAVQDIQKSKVAHKYSATSPLLVLFSWKGTFWPLIIFRYEMYTYTAIHTGLVIWNYYKQEDDDDNTGEDETFWGASRNMVPWAALSLLTPLMIFFLVFFLSQCYGRFTAYFGTARAIEKSLQDLTMILLTNVTDEKKIEPVDLRWEAVRYLTAAALVIYSRVTKLSEGEDAQMDVATWGRLLTRERVWQSEGGIELETTEWEKTMGWPRTPEQEDEFGDALYDYAKKAGVEGAAIFDGSPGERKSVCPPLLTAEEVQRLRRYPGGMITLVLCTWSMQMVKTASGGTLAGPVLNAAQGACLNLKNAAYEIRNGLGMPVPMPYFHALAMLQNINFALYAYTLCSFQSFLTIPVLMVVILITVGMREVAVALSNPFGGDDVDFPVNKWICAQLRSMALFAYQGNYVCECPNPAAADYRTVTERESRVKAAADKGEGQLAGGEL